ncbi:hypothetical protein EDF56_101343 [Novosphingobium sp. PhB165]|uniref:endonuclease/exonuclease/phosphatase family protein n=1 Tax=Novosphingobium sp. PhB165 TaxID=2485105 RepID=UPI00105332EE|nr:endonuclease/exonuclease/phosphatase family protein [Novosphingobium sp. PhB165]TCM21674.1 hypothetical protein EDF56_101343 [Novosphingobium sp. PhB165]
MLEYTGPGESAGAQTTLEATKNRGGRTSKAHLAAMFFAMAIVVGLVVDAFLSQPAVALPATVNPLPAGMRGDLSVMTYNVKGLPWPLASGRPEALAAIGQRLAQLRRMGRQPQVVVLQEAFIPEAKAIAREAGYAFVATGPQGRPAPNEDQAATRAWTLGETGEAHVDSGLVLMSDLPIRRAERAAFPAVACAGYDCLAAKGVLVAELALPGGGTVRVATTHLNCRKASGTSSQRSDAAYAQQAAFLSNVLARSRADGVPTILAGDFNQGQRPDRIAMLHGALDKVPGAEREDALSRRFDADPAGMARLAGAQWIRHKARDMQFTFDGSPARLMPVGIEIPFGTEPDGSMLSDHMGYTVHYAIRRGSQRA